MGFSGDVVNFAVIGAGRVGRVHACDIAARPRARRRTIVDPQAPDLHDLAAQYRAELAAEPAAALATGERVTLGC